ncbi:MAG: LrgB family protein [Candidatus Merdivicinus sp.]|jgi:predicted murein hydrolase (TIGR00659 family)
MLDWLSSPLFGITLSIAAYAAGCWIQKKLRSPLANPLLIAILLVIAFLKLTGIPLDVYSKGGDFISLFLAPATACLAISIYRQLPVLKKNLLPVLIGSAVGSAVSMGSVALLCKAFQLDAKMTASLLPKSVTTPIAMGIAEQHGGIIPITVAAVIITGIMGAILAPSLIRLFHVQNPIAAGLAIGTCSHAVGTSKALQLGEIEGAMSGIAIGTAGLITVLLAMLF